MKAYIKQADGTLFQCEGCGWTLFNLEGTKGIKCEHCGIEYEADPDDVVDMVDIKPAKK